MSIAHVVNQRSEQELAGANWIESAGEDAGA